VKPYADLPPRLAWQVAADLVALAWIVGWTLVAFTVRGVILELRGPGETLIEAGTSLQDTFSGAAESASDIPLIGDALADALGTGTGTGEALVDAGTAEIDRIESLAFWATVVLILLPLLVLLVTWLPARLRYAREAGAIVDLMRRGTHGDLLALRALTGRRVHRLTKLHIDPAGAWRRGDPDDIAALAQLELAEFGLRPR
jgi:hypothetical protein